MVKAKRSDVVKATATLRERFISTLSAANKRAPAAGALEAFRQTLKECEGEKAAPWRDVTDPLDAALAVLLTTDASTLTTDAIAELWTLQAREFKDDLGIKTAPPLEKALIQHAAVCWVRLSILEMRYTNVMKQSITLTLGAYWEKRLTAAQKRFTRACESLERVRKLSARVPKVQINVAAEGGRQVNVA
ncbi:MAG TPA: hypothetical protein VF240_17130 [Pyrinomonadaceae bacterium]